MILGRGILIMMNHDFELAYDVYGIADPTGYTWIYLVHPGAKPIYVAWIVVEWSAYIPMISHVIWIIPCFPLFSHVISGDDVLNIV